MEKTETIEAMAASRGMTVSQLKREAMAYLQCEGYDDAGNEYETLGAWLDRGRDKGIIDPYDGGRGFGQYGKED